MPTVLYIFGWRFFFYSNEGSEPIHIHAEKGDMECKYWLLVDELEITSNKILLKIDTQGFEYEVLKGAENSIKAGIFKWVIIELMTVEKYESAHLYTDIMSI
jgi:hypothetical protein